MSARRSCAERLIASQRKAARDYPSAIRIVIAHSHGGTAAIAALRGLPAQLAPAGIVTLASPFISTEKRAMPSGDRWALGVAEFVLHMGLMIAAWFLSSSILRFFVSDGFWERHETLATILFASVMVFLAEHFAGLLPGIANRRICLRRRALQMSASALRGCNLLVLRATADEASLALGIGDAAEVAHGMARRAFVIPRRIALMLERAMDRFGGVVRWIFNIMMIAAALLLIYIPFQDIAIDAGYSWVSMIPLYVFGIPMLAIAAVTMAGFSASLVLGVLAGASLLVSGVLSLVGYGPEYPLLGWDVRTTAETSPPGHTVPCHSLRLRSRARLRHGIYRHLRTRKVIAEWISQTFSPSCACPHVSSAAQDAKPAKT